MARAIAESVPVPESLAGCCVLGTVSAAIGANLKVQSAPDRLTRANLYIVPSALSGTGKSEAFRHATEPFVELEHGMIDQWERSDLPTLLADQEVLEIEIAALKKKISTTAKNGGTADVAILKEGLVEKLAVRADVEKLLRAPILTVEDVTIEELAVLLSHRDETLASLSPDAGAVINNLLGRYSNLGRTDENIYLRAIVVTVARLTAEADHLFGLSRRVSRYSGSFSLTSSILSYRKRRLPRADGFLAFSLAIRMQNPNPLLKTGPVSPPQFAMHTTV